MLPSVQNFLETIYRRVLSFAHVRFLKPACHPVADSTDIQVQDNTCKLKIYH